MWKPIDIALTILLQLNILYLAVIGIL